MQPTLSKPRSLERDPIVTQRILSSPFEFPKAKGKTKLYVVRVKEDAPFEFETICGETITKYDVSKDSKRAANSGRPPKIKYKTFEWDKGQLEAFKKRMDEMNKIVYDKETRDYKIIDISPHVEILTEEEYNKSFMITRDDEVIAP